MKQETLTVVTLKAVVTIATFVLVLFAAVKAYHTHGQIQSGWMMMCMFAMALTVISLGLINQGTSWFPHIIALLAIVYGGAFALHYFGGDQGIRELVQWLQWMSQKISKVYADTFY
jgi:hypothetical protein